MRFCKQFKIMLVNDKSVAAIIYKHRVVAYASLTGYVFEKAIKVKIPKYVTKDIRAIGTNYCDENRRVMTKKSSEDSNLLPNPSVTAIEIRKNSDIIL